MQEREASFLRGGGEMGRLIRALDWAATPLGPIGSWPQSLRSAVSIMLPSKAQIALFWGPELITLYNDAYRPVFGGKHPQALGQPVREAWAELWRAGLKELFGNVLATGEAFWARDRPFYMERHGFPEETFFDVSYDPVRDETGRVGGVFCIVSETTARVVGERRLRVLRDLGNVAAQAHSAAEAWALSAEVLASAPLDVPFADADLEDRAGWPPGLHDVAAFAGRMAVAGGPWPDPARRVMVLPLGGRPGETVGRLALGVSPRLAFDDAYQDFFRLVAGQIAASIAAAHAAEAERHRADALAELDRAKTAFFSNVSHEFRTPLTLMLGPLEELRQGALAAEDARQLSDIAHRNGRRLLRLVNTLLDFSRVEAGRVQARYQPTDIAAYTADLASAFRSACERAGLTLRVDCPPLGQPVHLDREMWEKIVLNLVSNAFKFTFEGEITVTVRARADHAEVTVRDTGVGIPGAELRHLFKRFHRVEAARGRSHEGTGIGLALVHELVGLHGGTIGVESEERRGTAFTVRIPFGTAHLDPRQVAPAAPGLPAASGSESFVEEALRWLPGHDDGAEPDTAPGRSGAARACVLLADDNADMRDYVRRLLAERFEVVAVDSGEAALAATAARRPDLVLADVMMPRLDGMQLLRRLRADPALADLPVVLLSARAGEEARVEGLQAGADDYVLKPFSARELLVRVQSNIDLAAARRQAAEAVRESEARFRTMADDAPVMVWVTEPDGACSYLSRSWYEFTGQTPEAALGFGWLEAVHPGDRDRSDRIFRSANAAREPFRLEYRLRGADGRYRWAIDSARPRLGPDGAFLGYIGSVIDIHERREAEEHRQLLLDELNHRVKNTLAVVQGMAQQTFKHRRDSEEASALFAARLGALASAHTLLTKDNWTRTPLLELARSALHPTGMDRIALTGPELTLDPRQALSIVMALHELATNALKHGALSRGAGRVELSWRERPEGGFAIVWRESGGPPVEPPRRRGFGSMLIERALAHELQGKAALSFEPGGVVCIIEAPGGPARPTAPSSA